MNLELIKRQAEQGKAWAIKRLQANIPPSNTNSIYNNISYKGGNRGEKEGLIITL